MHKNLAYIAVAAIAASPLALVPLAAQDNSDLFATLDTNKDGYVTPDEIKNEQKALFQRMLRTSDKDGDKKLSKDEFQAGLRPDETPRLPLPGGGAGLPMPQGGKGDPREFFSRMDTNRDGKLSKDEMPERMRDNYGRLDTNGDGSVSVEEFAQIGRQFGKSPAAGRGTPAVAPDGDAAKRAAETFDNSDANKDGKLSKDEVPEAARFGFGQLIERLNPGNDFLTKEQYVRSRTMFTQAEGGPGAQRSTDAMKRTSFEAMFDRTDSNSDGKLTKDEIPEERKFMRDVLSRAGGESITKEPFVEGMIAVMAQAFAQQPRGEGGARSQGARPEGDARLESVRSNGVRPDNARPDNARPDGDRPAVAPFRRPGGAPGGPPGAGGSLFGALDTDRDGELSTVEIAGAGAVLLKLDRNNDGKLTPEEVFPGGPPPGGMRGRPGEGPPRVGQPGNGLPGSPPGDRRPGQRGLGSYRERLKEVDANKDGKISKEEAPARLSESFRLYDTNSDGYLDEAEIDQMIRRMSEGGGERRPENK